MSFKHADGQTRKLTVRQHGAADLARNPQMAADEFALLRIVHDAGVPAPAPVYLDQSGEMFETPVVVLEYIEGEIGVRACGCARPPAAVRHAYLAAIHRIDCASHDITFLPRPRRSLVAATSATGPAALDDSLAEGRIRDCAGGGVALAAAAIHPACCTATIGRAISYGAMGGSSASSIGRMLRIGDPLADIANSRLDLLWAVGEDAMHDFTRVIRR